jgi:hypothetical protein
MTWLLSFGVWGLYVCMLEMTTRVRHFSRKYSTDSTYSIELLTYTLK